MKLKTKFAPGQFVYTLANNQCQEAIVQFVRVIADGNGEAVDYRLKAMKGNADLGMFEEKRVFRSKTQLKASL